MLFTYDLDLLVFIYCVLCSTFAFLNHSLAWNIQILFMNSLASSPQFNMFYPNGVNWTDFEFRICFLCKIGTTNR